MTYVNILNLRTALPAAVILAGLGIAAVSNATTTTAAATAPLACDIAVDQTGAMVHFQGRVQAHEAMTGTYALTLSGGGTNIRQGGAFSAREGEIVTLGQANLSGDPSRYDATMVLSVNGATYNCATNL
ncbi:curli-like amyloid fiber formation chaperone CsgH [Alterinioella nitratireducens]|uniref:curli-like amyloid fiber formation chaperone CsgH n=1 Tax=Alterinioella nitratireducens TaxID=2735915 RepID=UPI00405A4385